MIRVLLGFNVLFLACKTANSPISDVDQVFKEVLETHGGNKYDQAHYEFTFRDKVYRFHNDDAKYDYEVRYSRNDSNFVDHLTNDGFERMINGEAATLTEKKEKSGYEALNSVIYFATLPHKLQDPAVNKEYKGQTEIKGKNYDVLRVSFDEEGGGTDHDDNYYYWINSDSHEIDYLAYNYQVNDGGVRFREAYNKQRVDGILFQDYVNYKAEIGTPLSDLPSLFEAGELKKLSEIKTEKVKSLRKREQ